MALLAVYLGVVVAVSRLAIGPLRGRPLWQSSAHVLLLSIISAAPEMVSPYVLGPGRVSEPAIVGVVLVSNLLGLAVLWLAEAGTGGRLLARSGLDHLLAVVCAAVMTMATAGAILIENTEPVGAPFGHVLSLGLLIACLVHLKWTSSLAPTGRTANPRAPLPLAIPVGLAACGALLVLLTLLLGRRYAELYGVSGRPTDYPVLLVAVLAAAPEFTILLGAIRGGRPDVGCAVLLGSLILNLTAVAAIDLIDMKTTAYRVDNPVALLIVALISTAVLGGKGACLVHEDTGAGKYRG